MCPRLSIYSDVLYFIVHYWRTLIDEVDKQYLWICCFTIYQKLQIGRLYIWRVNACGGDGQWSGFL